MKYGTVLRFVIFILLPGLLSGCLSLKELGDYSANSVKNIKNYDELGYSFTRSCKDKCLLEQQEKNQIYREYCDCQANIIADSVTGIIYNAAKGYFSGLAILSGNNLTNYSFDPIKKSLVEGKFGDIHVSSSHAEAYSSIATILTRLITDGYRKNKLAEFIGDANAPIKMLLEALGANLVNLSNKLDLRKDRLVNYYFDLTNDKNLTVVDKKKIIEEYNLTMADIEAKKKQIAVYGNSLKLIADGHQALFDKRNDLNIPGIKEQISQYSADIRSLNADFNNLKKRD